MSSSRTKYESYATYSTYSGGNGNSEKNEVVNERFSNQQPPLPNQMNGVPSQGIQGGMNGLPPPGMMGQGGMNGLPPQGMPPQGMPPQGMPPQGMPPQGMPSQGMPSQGMPPQGMPPQGKGVQHPPSMEMYQARAQEHRVKNIDPAKMYELLTNPAHFFVQQQPLRLFIKVSTSWCGPCQKIAPEIKSLSNNPKYAGILFLEVDGDELVQDDKLASKLRVSAVPSFFGFVAGKQVGFETGVLMKDIVGLLDKITNA